MSGTNRRGGMVLAAGAVLVLAAGFAAARQQTAPTTPTTPITPAQKSASDAAEATRARAVEVASRAVAYLRSTQDAATGGWAIREGAPQLPGITALVVSGMHGFEPSPGARIDERDESVARAVAYLLKMQQKDGGIYDTMLPSYNTSLAVSALSKVPGPEVRAAVAKAVEFLKTLQYSEGAVVREELGESPKPVDKNHPFYGGVGYGRHGRPDLSNTGIWIQALHDAGVEPTDPAFQRALVFLQRTQMAEKIGEMKVNDMEYAKGSTQGGFIYSTSENRDRVGSGQSMVGGMIDETLSDGSVASRLRAYGSMTYTGFKSYIYAGLKRDDPRVQAAMGWILKNYTLEENPGLGTDGMYYYFVVFGKAMGAWGEPVVNAAAPGKEPAQRDWRADLVERLAALQQEDGSFKVVDDRWMEDNPVLITAYALAALREVTDKPATGK